MEFAAGHACHALGVTPRPDESLTGFVFRLARRRGMADASLLVRQAGFRKHRSDIGPGDGACLDALARLSGVVRDELLAISFRWAGERLLFRGVALEPSFLVHYPPTRPRPSTGRRVCPDCLAEQAFHRAIWHLAFCRICPIHARYLVDACPDCGRPLTWAGADLCRCGRCGRGDLRAAVSDRVDVGLLDGLKAVLGLVGVGRFAAEAAEARLLAPLSDLPDGRRVSFLYCFGMDLVTQVKRSLFTPWPGERATELTHLALGRGLEACRRWPEALAAGPGYFEAEPPDRSHRRRWVFNIARWVDELSDDMGGNVARSLADLPVEDFALFSDPRLKGWQATAKRTVQKIAARKASAQLTKTGVQITGSHRGSHTEDSV